MILSARWSILFEEERFDNGEGGVERGARRIVPHDDPHVVGGLLRETVHRLLEAGRRVVLVYPVPEVGWNVPEYLLRTHQFGVKRDAPLSTSHAVFLERNRHALEQLDGLGEHPNLIRVRPAEMLCDRPLAGRCVAEMDGRPLYYDDDHLNSLGAALLAEVVVEAMRHEGWM
ncbi:MAG: hypothetical protein GWO02_20875 [Gammaproteobacteria bacterium]|nr:hypothetical protein [Gammaproteobacteria bacterium]